MWRRVTQSGRLDLNQRSPAPKAGAIPGYATPRKTFCKLLCPADLAQRTQQRAKRAPAMTHLRFDFPPCFGHGAAKFGNLDIRIISEATISTRLVDHVS